MSKKTMAAFDTTLNEQKGKDNLTSMTASVNHWSHVSVTTDDLDPLKDGIPSFGGNDSDNDSVDEFVSSLNARLSVNRSLLTSNDYQGVLITENQNLDNEPLSASATMSSFDKYLDHSGDMENGRHRQTRALARRQKLKLNSSSMSSVKSKY
jgi:hypothetical protein